MGEQRAHGTNLVSEPPPAGMPGDFIPLAEPLHAWIDRKLGYLDDARFVLSRYDPRVDGVSWRDGVSHGFGCGARSELFGHIPR